MMGVPLYSAEWGGCGFGTWDVEGSCGSRGGHLWVRFSQWLMGGLPIGVQNGERHPFHALWNSYLSLSWTPPFPLSWSSCFTTLGAVEERWISLAGHWLTAFPFPPWEGLPTCFLSEPWNLVGRGDAGKAPLTHSHVSRLFFFFLPSSGVLELLL